MPQIQKPPDLDQNGQPVNIKPPDLDATGLPISAKKPGQWSLATIGESLKKGLLEGLPEMAAPGWDYPGAQRSDWIGDISRLSMIPAGGISEVYNKLLDP